MVEESGPPSAASEPGTVSRKRQNRFKKQPNAKKMKVFPGMGTKAKVSNKMRKVIRKRVKAYNSDSDGGNESEPESIDEGEEEEKKKESDGKSRRTDGEAERGRGGEGSDDEHVPLLKFGEGCNAFSSAFQKIVNINADDKSLGPVLAAHRRLVVAKLAEEDTKQKVQKEKKKEKLLIDEMGHVKPANFLDTHDKVLIGIATKGVVKFFNAVNKAQSAQKELNPSRFKDAKALTKRRKEAFMSELKRSSAKSVDTAAKASGKEDGDQPAWAPLRDSFMLTNSKLKDWDKMAEETEMDI